MNLIVLEGCNGEWAQKCYLPFLAQEAVKGSIELWAVDTKPQITLSTPAISVSWRDAISKGNAHYLDKTRSKESYETIYNVNYVFVVTPDQYHCEIAEFWRERLNKGGRIFIEKPLDASMGKAKELKNKMGKVDIAYGFDHYLAKAYPFLQHAPSHLRKIGKISKIEFNILEPSPILASQVKTLDKGIIFDLFCHVLAVVGAVVDRDFTFDKVKLGDVITAKYKNCPISGETFAHIEFSISGNVEVTAILGKGVGESESKCMTIKGSGGTIRLDFAEDHDKGQLKARPVESFLEVTLQGEKPLSAPGALSLDTAFAILKLLADAKSKAKLMPRRYDIGASAAEIMRIIG